MSWQPYVDAIMGKPNVADVALFGLNDRRLWACHDEGELGCIKPEDLEVLLGPDRTTFLQQGVQIGKLRCSVMIDEMNEGHVMNLQTKDRENSASVLVVCTLKVIMLVMGKKAIRGNTLLNDVNEIVEGLKNAQY